MKLENCQAFKDIQLTPGPPGADGQDGVQGIQGIPGPQGPPGNDGADAPIPPCPVFTPFTVPVVTASGSATEDGINQVLETDRFWRERFDCQKREVYVLKRSLRLTHAAAGGWGIVTVPNVGGWDRDISDLGTYRQNGNTNNPDNDNRGAMPDAPYMGKEAKHWRNSTRIYLNQVNDRDNDSTIWVEWTETWVRN